MLVCIVPNPFQTTSFIYMPRGEIVTRSAIHNFPLRAGLARDSQLKIGITPRSKRLLAPGCASCAGNSAWLATAETIAERL